MTDELNIQNEAESLYTAPNKKKKLLKLALIAVLGTVLGLAIFYLHLVKINEPSNNFPVNQQIIIEQGTDIRAITEILEDNGVVRSKHLLYYFIVFLYDPTSIKASTYIFEEPISTLEVARRLAEGDFDTDLIRFTHFEGERFELLALRADNNLPNFNTDNFLRIAEEQQLEGKLFPDTYFIPITFNEEDLLELLTKTFENQIASLSDQIESQSLNLEEILILASIIEREANTPESMKLVSSVLQNRLEIGMALQADASIEYILDKPLTELTPEDLKIDSPYNTYLYTGLPPTPIGNPGLDSIMAVLEPTPSNYFYYITGNDGEFYFSETYTEHLNNIEKYLR